MTSGPRGKKHLIFGLLLVLAGAFFIVGSFTSDHRDSPIEKVEIVE